MEEDQPQRAEEERRLSMESMMMMMEIEDQAKRSGLVQKEEAVKMRMRKMRMKGEERTVRVVVGIQEEVQVFWMVVLGHSLLLMTMRMEGMKLKMELELMMEVKEVKRENQMLCFFPIQEILLSLIVSLNQIVIEELERD